MSKKHRRPAASRARAEAVVAARGGLEAQTPLASRSAIRFMLIFGGMISAYFALTVTFAVRDSELTSKRPVLGWLVSANESAQRLVCRPYQEAIAAGVGATVRALGYRANVEGREIRSVDFAMAVTHGCDGLELSLLLSAGILAYPARFARKVFGLLVGFGAIASMNFVRVVTLWMVGVHWRAGFDFIHFNLWPAVLICCTLALFIAWLRSAARPAAVIAKQSTQESTPVFAS